MTRYLGRRPEDPDYGLGEHTIDCDKLGLIDEQELTARLIRTFDAPGYRPPRLPTVAMELHALSKKPDVEFYHLERLLEQDAILAGEVLSLARSAYYSGTRQVESLRDALVRLGMQKLREIVLQAAMSLRVFRSTSYRGCMERLRYHCRATAHLCRLTSRYTPVGEEQAFLCGLLHDVGIAGILLVLGDVGQGKKAPDLAVLWPSIEAAHARAGARMVKLWKLPPEVVLAVEGHHQVRIYGADHPIAATVCLAEALATELDMGFVPTGAKAREESDLDDSGLLAHGRIDRTDDATLARARQALAMSDSTLEILRVDARKWAEAQAVPVAG